MKDVSFGNYIAKLRREKGMTQAQLALKLKISDKAVSRWENGLSKPRGNYILRLAAALGTSADKILSGGKNGEAVISDISSNGTDKELPKFSHINLIPKKAEPNGNYLCTWWLQLKTAERLGLSGNITVCQRDCMTAELLFDDESYYHVFKQEHRSGLYFLLDDGWDVPYGTDSKTSGIIFGSMQPDKEKFSAFGKTTVEILSGLVNKVKEIGYAGLGLWVSAQRANREIGTTEDAKAARDYWVERAKQSSAAGVSYWKVDWGAAQNNFEYRKMMTECVKEYAPGLIIEHAAPQGPYTGAESPTDEIAKRMRDFITISDAFRTYDVKKPFEDSATVCRIYSMLTGFDKSSIDSNVQGIINVESQPLVAVGLGCSLGIMRYTKETEAALRWQRLAPPFSVKDTDFVYSTEMITDSIFFSNAPSWWLTQFTGKDCSISTPAVCARGTKLPKVKTNGVTPRIAACSHPITHNYCVASMKRCIDPNREMIAYADVTIYPDSIGSAIGIFGYFKSITIEFPTDISPKSSVYAQCLLCDSASDITKEVKIVKNKMTIPGKVLRLNGNVSSDSGITYDPCLVVKLIG